MLEVGYKIPDVVLSDDAGRSIRLHDFIGQHPLVIYFYPKDGTPGCTREACAFRDHIDDFLKHGAKVIGISGDSVESHRTFKDKYGLNFTLLSDNEGKAMCLFKVKSLLGLWPGRVTYVTDLQGIIRYRFNSALRPVKHVKEALEYIAKSAHNRTA